MHDGAGQGDAGMTSEGRQIIEERIGEVRRLVIAALRQWFGKGYETDDLIQEGLIGVLTHCDRYDPERGSLGNFVTLVARDWVMSRVFTADNTHKRRINREALRLDAPIDNSETPRTLADTVPDDCDIEGEVMDRAEVERIRGIIDAMEPRTALVLRARLEEGMGLREIGKSMGISKERVRQIEAGGIRRIRALLRADKKRPDRRKDLQARPMGK